MASSGNEEVQQNNDNDRGQSMLKETEETKLPMFLDIAGIVHLFPPVLLCMAYVVFTMNTVDYYSVKDEALIPFTEETDDTAERLVNSFGNALTYVVGAAILSCIVIALYYFCSIKFFFKLSIAILLSILTTTYLREVIKSLNIAVDIVSYIFFLWNFMALGMICIYWKAPMVLQRGYQIFISAQVALICIKHFPQWSLWIFLVLYPIWDLITVLCPYGPLKIFIDTAEARNEPLPSALVYSTGNSSRNELFDATTSNDPLASDVPLVILSSAEPHPTPTPATDQYSALCSRNHQQTEAQNDIQRPNLTLERNVESNTDQHPHQQEGLIEVDLVENYQLGFADFIVYSILMGNTCFYGDWNATIACCIAVLVGLTITVLMSAVYRKPLPALPISIFLGLVSFFATNVVITPFVSELTMLQVTL